MFWKENQYDHVDQSDKYVGQLFFCSPSKRLFKYDFLALDHTDCAALSEMRIKYKERS